MILPLKNVPKQRIIAWSILIALFIYACIILALSTGTYDTGDGVAHYLISRYSWHHHDLFLSDWGKPFFTLVSSPFSQFGLKGLTFFNIFCGLGASYFAYKTAEKLEIPFPYLAIIFTFSSPIFFSVINSGLTEPLFSLMLIYCIWLILNEHYYLSAAVFSILPWVRPEYLFVLPLFVFYYILKRKFWANLLLALGTIIIIIIGFIYYKDLHWLASQSYYTQTNSNNYSTTNRGNLLTYIAPAQGITGIALMILVILGILSFVGHKYLKKYCNQRVKSNYFLEEFLLILGGYFAILMCHTLLWSTGIFATLGMLRFMATLIPLAAIIGLRGLQLLNLIPDLIKMPKIKGMVAICFTGLVLYAPFVSHNIPFKMDKEAVVLKNATDWLKETNNTDKKMFYLSPFITCSLNIDPFDTSKHGDLWSMNSQMPDQDMPHGSIMIWDSHYGPNEGRIQSNTLMKDTNLTLLNQFKPDENFTTLGGFNYEVRIFMRK